MRGLPDFLVIGAQRCGTSSLYKWLEHHPDVVASLRKETEFFSFRTTRGLDWYRGHFPSRRRRTLHRMRRGRDPLVFEATPNYLFHPDVPARAHAVVPDARLVVLLRNPVDRAYSHYRHMVRHGKEPLGFEEAIDREAERIAGEAERMHDDPAYRSHPWDRWSYVSRGRYAEQLERWLALYPRDRLLVIRSEDLYADPGVELGRLLGFLGLPAGGPSELRNWSAVHPSDQGMNPATRERLDAAFAGPNRALDALLGVEMRWSK